MFSWKTIPLKCMKKKDLKSKEKCIKGKEGSEKSG